MAGLQSKCIVTMKQQRNRKQRHGVSTHPMTFKADNEVWDFLQTKSNKGRYINNLVYRDMMQEPETL